MHIEAPKYLRQMLATIKEQIDCYTIIVGDFNTTFTPMDRSSGQKISKEKQDLSDTLGQLDLIDIYLSFTPKQYISLFPYVCMGHSPGQVTSWTTNLSLVINNKKIEIISSIFSDYNVVRLDIKYRKKNYEKHEHGG